MWEMSFMSSAASKLHHCHWSPTVVCWCGHALQIWKGVIKCVKLVECPFNRGSRHLIYTWHPICPVMQISKLTIRQESRICGALQPNKSRQADCVGYAYKQLVDLAACFTTNLVSSSLSDLQEGGAALQIGWASAAAFWPAANSWDSGRRKKGEDEKTSVRKWGRGTNEGVGGHMEKCNNIHFEPFNPLLCLATHTGDQILWSF